MRSPRDRIGAFDHDADRSSGRGGRRLGAVLGAAAAALASVGLAYWMSAGEDRALSPTRAPAAAPANAAAARADAGEVVRAYEQLQQIYADQGTDGVIGFSRACAASLRSDPGVLDFCLAFDLYASALGGEDAAMRAWRAGVEDRDLAMARAALPPGEVPAMRLAEVRDLARRASLEAPAAPAPAARRPAAPPRADAAAACRARATPAQRTVCASPALREADHRLRLAYRRALAAGVNPRRLARDQARFRAAVQAAAPDRAAIARLYHRRTRALERLARPPPSFDD